MDGHNITVIASDGSDLVPITGKLSLSIIYIAKDSNPMS